MANPSFRKGVFQSMENEIYDQKKNLPSEHWLAHEELDCCGEALQRVVVLSHHRCVVQHGSSNIGFSQYRWSGQTERRAGENSRISSAGIAVSTFKIKHESWAKLFLEKVPFLEYKKVSKMFYIRFYYLRL